MTDTRPDAVITDLDGSLLGPDKRVGARDAAAIRRLMELGIPVAVCTGRPPLGVRGLAEELGLSLALCSNGGCCYDFAEGRVISAALLDHGVARRMADWLTREGQPFLIHTPRRIYTTPGTDHIRVYGLRDESEKGRITPGMPLDGLEILKILATECDGPALCARAGQVFPASQVSLCASEACFMDVNPPAVDKGRGLGELARAKGWDMGRILALGDNYNDLPMLDAAGYGVSPATGIPEAQAAARFVSAPCGQDPLSAALDHFFPGLLGDI